MFTSEWTASKSNESLLQIIPVKAPHVFYYQHSGQATRSVLWRNWLFPAAFWKSIMVVWRFPLCCFFIYQSCAWKARTPKCPNVVCLLVWYELLDSLLLGLYWVNSLWRKGREDCLMHSSHFWMSVPLLPQTPLSCCTPLHYWLICFSFWQYHAG